MYKCNTWSIVYEWKHKFFFLEFVKAKDYKRGNNPGIHGELMSSHKFAFFLGKSGETTPPKYLFSCVLHYFYSTWFFSWTHGLHCTIHKAYALQLQCFFTISSWFPSPGWAWKLSTCISPLWKSLTPMYGNTSLNFVLLVGVCFFFFTFYSK